MGPGEEPARGEPGLGEQRREVGGTWAEGAKEGQGEAVGAGAGSG